MENELINHEYLKELLDVAEDQKENDLVTQLFNSLLKKRDEFLQQAAKLLANENEMQFELHKLKNQFANLGCVAVSSLLEKMYQLAKSHDMSQVQRLLSEFQNLSERSLNQLRTELSH